MSGPDFPASVSLGYPPPPVFWNQRLGSEFGTGLIKLAQYREFRQVFEIKGVTRKVFIP